MTQAEIKEKIKKLENAIERIGDGEDKDSIELQKAVDRLKKKLEMEVKKPAKKVSSGAKQEKKPVQKKPATSTKKPAKKLILKKAIETQKQPKDITIKKGEKKETHTINTAFAEDIHGAILVLNKERYVIREKKDRKTGKMEQVKHSPEYKNAKTIEKRVNTIFNSSIYDIAKTAKEKKEKKDVIDEAEAIRDLTTLWLNEVDILINNEDVADLAKIKKLMLGLIKEARKNDPKDKYKLQGGLSKIAEKYGL
jgi:hypothetical protein